MQLTDNPTPVAAQWLFHAREFPMDAVIHETEMLNHLLQGEVSAVETYTQAMNRFDDLEVICELQLVRDEHGRAVRALRDQIIQFGIAPSDGSGAWSTFNLTGLEAMDSIGPATVLAVLCQGEEHAIREYEDALERSDLHLDSERLIRAKLLPGCRAHVEKLNALLGGMGH
jgi:hypothetical protein